MMDVVGTMKTMRMTIVTKTSSRTIRTTGVVRTKTSISKRTSNIESKTLSSIGDSLSEKDSVIHTVRRIQSRSMALM